jgi:hypothetical protein
VTTYSSMKAGLEVNAKKTKHIFITHQQNVEQNYNIRQY